MDEKKLYRLHADFCKFMGHAKRIEIIFLLGKRELCVDDIAKGMKAQAPNISQHLAVMRSRNVVAMRQVGIKKYYRLSNPEILKACLIMQKLMIKQMCSEFKGLKGKQ